MTAPPEGIPIDEILIANPLRKMTGNALKVLLACYVIERKLGASRGENFPAAVDALCYETNLTPPTVRKVRAELEACGEIAVTESTCAILRKKVDPLIPPKGVLQSSRGRNGASRSHRSKGTVKLGIRRVKNFSQLSALTERRMAVHKALTILKAADTGKYSQLCMAKLALLCKDGYSIDDALEVVRWARAKYDAGDRFALLLNLIYLWSRGKFVGYLTAARTTPTHAKEFSVISDDAERAAWDADYQRRIREKGLVQ